MVSSGFGVNLTVILNCICNNSIDTTTVYGKMGVLAHYNGRELYNNTLDLCTLEEKDEEKVLQCPIRRGWHYFVKEHNVSPLLPKVNINNRSEILVPV